MTSELPSHNTHCGVKMFVDATGAWVCPKCGFYERTEYGTYDGETLRYMKKKSDLNGVKA